MVMSRKDIFQTALKKRKQEREKEKARKVGGGFEFEDIAYTALQTNDHKIVRVLGYPMEARDNVPETEGKYSAKQVNYSMIVGDNGKKFRCIWPAKTPEGGGSSWILWKVFDKVMASRSSQGQRVYLNETRFPDVFNRVHKNGNPQNNLERGWLPTRVVVMNVLDRHDMEWHQEHKHSKILSKKGREYGDEGNIWFEPGIPLTTYNLIVDELVENYGLFDEYDISIKKMDAQPWYGVFHASEEIKRIPAEYRSLVVDGPLTDEEKSYELYDLDKLFPITTYKKIYDNLGVFIQEVDKKFKTHFFEELTSLYEKEKAQWEEENRNNNSEESEDDDDDEVVEIDDSDVDDEVVEIEEEEVKPKKKIVKKASKESIPWNDLADGSYNGIKYEGVNSLSDEEKEMVVGIKDNGYFEYVKKDSDGKPVFFYTAEDVYDDDFTANFPFPENFRLHPVTGDALE